MTLQVSAKSSEQKPRNNFNVKTTPQTNFELLIAPGLSTFDLTARDRQSNFNV